MMRAVVLAAGQGKRTLPLTADRSKVLLPAGPEPLLHRLLRQLASANVHDITIVTHHHADEIRASVGDGGAWGGMRINWAPQGAPRGTGHAVGAANVPHDEAFLAVNGDVFLPEGTLAEIVKRGPRTLAAARVADATSYGVFLLKGGKAVSVVEKSATPPSDLANAGVYYCPAGFSRLVDAIEPSIRGEIELTDALNASFAEQPWNVVELKDWVDIGRPWDLLAAAKLALAELPERREGTVEAGATLHGKVTVERGAIVKAGSYVEGPVHIGPDCVIGPNCYLRPDTVLLARVKIGNAVEIKGSVIMEDSHVAHLSYVGDSVLGRRVNFGAGTLVANLRHDGKTVKVDGVDSRRRKLGVIVGDDAHTGINTSLNVGVVLGKGATTTPGEVVMRSRP